MNKFFKRAISFVVATVIIASMCTVAMAQTEMDNMVFAGYDLTNPLAPNKIFNEVINGYYTNKQVLVPVTPEWKAEGFEAVYPYAGYDRMYLEGNAQKITKYNNVFPQWEERRQDWMWELKAPYTIWERQQTKVENKADGWQWDFGNEVFGIPDEVLKTRTNRAAVVENIEWKTYGFGKYDNEGNILTEDEAYMYDYFNVDAIADWNEIVANELTVANLSAKDENNRYIVTDEYIEAIIPVVESKYITAKFTKDSDEGLQTKDVAAEFLVHKADWEWDADSLKTVKTAKVEWTAPAYEMAEPYYMYQYLIVNGIVFDGTDGKDTILRYTGGKATPEVTWKFAFFQYMLDENGNEIDGVYEVVEQKFVDGVAAVDANNNPIYRVPTGEYGNTFFKLNGDIIEYWVTDKAGNAYILATAENFTGSLGGLIDAYCNGSFRYVGRVPVEPYKMLP